jgi:hypothetical protein
MAGAAPARPRSTQANIAGKRDSSICFLPSLAVIQTAAATFLIGTQIQYLSMDLQTNELL